MIAQRGEITTEMVVLTPVLVMLVMLCVQVAAWSHAATVATSVAARAAQAEARYGATIGEGEQLGRSLLGALGVSGTPVIAVHRSTAAVTAEVTLSIPGLVPGLPTEVRRRVVVSRERVLTELQR